MLGNIVLSVCSRIDSFCLKIYTTSEGMSEKSWPAQRQSLISGQSQFACHSDKKNVGLPDSAVIVRESSICLVAHRFDPIKDEGR